MCKTGEQRLFCEPRQAGFKVYSWFSGLNFKCETLMQSSVEPFPCLRDFFTKYTAALDRLLHLKKKLVSRVVSVQSLTLLPSPPCQVLYAAAWICGEFSEYLPNIRSTVESMLRTRPSSLPPHILAVYVQNVLKLYARMLARAEESEQPEDVDGAMVEVNQVRGRDGK